MTSQPPRAPNTSLRRKPLPINRDSILVVDDSASPTDTRSRTDSPVPSDPALPKHYGQPGVSDTPSPPPVFEPSPSPTPEPSSAPVSESPSSPAATTQSKPLPPPPEAAPPRPPAHAQRPESPMMAATSVMPLTGPGPMVPEKPAPIVTQQPQSPPQDEPLSSRPVSDPKGPTKLTKANRESDPKRPQSSMQSDSPPPPPSREGSSAERSSRVIRPPQGRARSASAQPLGSRRSSFGPRIMSQAMDAMRGLDTRQLTKNPPQIQNAQNQTPAKTVEKLRRSIMPAAPKPRAKSLDNQAIPGLDAWIISPDDTKAEYNTSLLTNAERVPELWNDAGNLYVSLRPVDDEKGPSFKIPYPAIASSLILVELIQDISPGPSRARSRTHDYRDGLAVEDVTRPTSYVSSASYASGSESPEEYLLHIPPPLPENAGPNASPSLDRLVAIRNLFAFLTGQPLVATKTQSSAFDAFMQIASLLEEFAFTSPDGSSFGHEVDLSFSFYIRQLSLGDVRHSRERTIQTLLLAERMRSVELYNEVFTHAVGKYSALVNLKSPTWNKVSSLTRQRLDRAHLELLNRQHNVNVHIEQFDFPGIFTGTANSTSLTEFRSVKYKTWRSAYSKMRSFTMSYYKGVFGSWPPKASSRKNPFSESGLNRLVLKTLYSDMCALYDLLADRTALTSRVINKMAEETEDQEETEKSTNPMITALRRILSESDNASPPVLPPIPFDIPRLPTMTSILENYDKMPPKEQARFDKKVKGNELRLVLEKSYDYKTNTIHRNNPFLAKFKEFEAKEARGKVAGDIADQRIGYWLFMYVVIQALPILVMDAPGLMHTDGVEYFLCQPPLGNPPWAEDVGQVRKMWYEVSGGAGYVELAADAVLFSVEAIHHRSHCWLAAKSWEAALQDETLEQTPTPEMPLEAQYANVYGGLGSGTPSTLSIDTAPSPAMGHHSPSLGASPIIRPRNNSPGPLAPPSRAVSQAHRSSVVLGIEPVFDLPEGLAVPGERSSRVLSHDRNSSLGPSPLGDLYKHRSVSMGNLSALATVQSAAGSSEDADNSGTTFDDILGKKEKKEKKRKSFFFA